MKLDHNDINDMLLCVCCSFFVISIIAMIVFPMADMLGCLEQWKCPIIEEQYNYCPNCGHQLER